MCRQCAYHPELSAECRRIRTEVLTKVHLFEGLSPSALETVCDGMTEVTLEPEQWLFFQGDLGSRFYLVLDGDVALLRQSADGEEVIVMIVGRGELFGEELILQDSPTHLLSARAVGATRLASLDLADLRAALGTHPDLALKLASTVQRRNALLLDEIERVTVQDAGQRLLSFLESHAAWNDGVPLRMTKRVLAARLAIRPETLSRVLARLKSCQLVREVDGALSLARDDACGTCLARLWGCPGPARMPEEPPAAPRVRPGAYPA